MKTLLYYDVFSSPFGEITLIASERGLHRVDLSGNAVIQLQGDHVIHKESSMLKHVRDELAAYFRGDLRFFTVEPDTGGTVWQLKIWQILREIPYGETLSYGKVARLAGKPGAAQAAGQACGANPIPIIVPCHRVVGVNNLGGFSAGPGWKENLLELERLYSKKSR